LKSSHQLSKYNWINFSSKQRSFTLRNHPAGRIQPHNGPVLARGPYVWHPWFRIFYWPYFQSVIFGVSQID